MSSPGEINRARKLLMILANFLDSVIFGFKVCDTSLSLEGQIIQNEPAKASQEEILLKSKKIWRVLILKVQT